VRAAIFHGPGSVTVGERPDPVVLAASRADASGAQSFRPTLREFCRALSTLVGNRAFD